MLTINYSWQRFLSPCGRRCHKSCHRIMPMHSQVDSCILNWAYSLTHPKESLDTLRTPVDKCLCACKGSFSQSFLIKWEHSSSLGGREDSNSQTYRYSVEIISHIAHHLSSTIFALSKPPSSTLSTSSILLLVLQARHMQRSYKPIKWRRKENTSFPNEGSVRLGCSFLFSFDSRG